MVVGGILVATSRSRWNRIRLIAGSSLVFGVLSIALGLAPTLWVFFAVMLLIGLAVPFFSTPSMTLLQETVEPERQGRVFGFVGIVMAVAMPIGMLVFGPLADVVPIEAILVGAGIATFVVVGLALWLPAGRRAVAAAHAASRGARRAAPAAGSRAGARAGARARRQSPDPATPSAGARPATPATIGAMPATDPVAAARAARDLPALDAAISDCVACPRLVAWREEQARVKVARFRDETYWGRAVPGFGDPRARILLVGLAPGAHGANRTGRVFTGDASGDFLWRALHAVGLADRPVGRRASDGLALNGVRVAGRRPLRTAGEQADARRSRPRAARTSSASWTLLDRLQVIVPLGGIGWDATLRSLATLGYDAPTPKPRFGHGAETGSGRTTSSAPTTRASRTRSPAASRRR